jgi:hypothetical protein
VIVKVVGFYGGHSVYELGTISDVALFFRAIDLHIVQACPGQDWSLLTDRLYRRYLRQDELDGSIELMDKVKNKFMALPGALAEKKEYFLEGEPETWINLELPTLADVFSGYFEGFAKACGSAVSFADHFNIYQPVRIVISDLPWFMLESQRPLGEYDALEGDPFWLR